MKIGVQMYTLHEYLKNGEEIEATLKRIKGMGFNTVQLSALGPCDVDLLAGWTKDLGLEVCGGHDPWERLSQSAELKKLIGEYKKLGSSHIGLGCMPDFYPHTYEGYTRFIKKINEICRQVKDEGLSFGYHNHNFEFQKWDGVRLIDRIIEECPELYIILDVFWVQAGGMNPCVYLDKLKGRIKIVHLKDFRMKVWERQFAEIGQGNLDWSEIIPLCEKNGIPYAVIEQDGDFLIDPFESLALSRKFLVENGYMAK